MLYLLYHFHNNIVVVVQYHRKCIDYDLVHRLEYGLNNRMLRKRNRLFHWKVVVVVVVVVAVVVVYQRKMRQHYQI